LSVSGCRTFLYFHLTRNQSLKAFAILEQSFKATSSGASSIAEWLEPVLAALVSGWRHQ
jgi:hypothetical protein